MSDPVLAEANPDTVIAESLARYKSVTGVDLTPADPRRLHLLGILSLLSHVRALIDFSGKQSMLRFVVDEWIDELCPFWGVTRLGARPSPGTVRFHYSTSAAHTVPAGTRVSFGDNLWSVTEDTSATGSYVDAPVECTVAGGSTNGVVAGQIDNLVDPASVPGCVSVENTTETISGRNVEGLEDLRIRLRGAPESRSTCGPANAYKAAALEASASVADVVALGPDDGPSMDGSPPDDGEVFVLVIQGARDSDGVLTSVVPDPDAGLLATVNAALTPEDVRPLGDSVTVKAPNFEDYDTIVHYYIARSRANSAASIQVAVQAAYDAFHLWQQSKIGRDINPSELNRLIVNAGAKRTVIASPAFEFLPRDVAARLSYTELVYAGVEDD